MNCREAGWFFIGISYLLGRNKKTRYKGLKLFKNLKKINFL